MQILLGYSEEGAALKGRPHNAHMIFTLLLVLDLPLGFSSMLPNTTVGKI